MGDNLYMTTTTTAPTAAEITAWTIDYLTVTHPATGFSWRRLQEQFATATGRDLRDVDSLAFRNLLDGLADLGVIRCSAGWGDYSGGA